MSNSLKDSIPAFVALAGTGTGTLIDVLNNIQWGPTATIGLTFTGLIIGVLRERKKQREAQIADLEAKAAWRQSVNDNLRVLLKHQEWQLDNHAKLSENQKLLEETIIGLPCGEPKVKCATVKLIGHPQKISSVSPDIEAVN